MTDVYLEIGKTKVFACSLEWPGWARSARTEELALEALFEYIPRYAVIAKRANLSFKPDDPVIVQRVPGGTTTDFGAPDKPVKADFGPYPLSEVDLLRAAWSVFDDVVAKSPQHLRKGPRGGGRDRDKMADHVLGAEVSYARTLGLKPKQPALDDRPAIDLIRNGIVDALTQHHTDGQPLTPKGWPPRYTLRRMAWHVIDHLWEMEDKSET